MYIDIYKESRCPHGHSTVPSAWVRSAWGSFAALLAIPFIPGVHLSLAAAQKALDTWEE